MTTSLEAMVGKLSGQVELLLVRDDKAESNRKALYEKVEEVAKDVQAVNLRLTAAELAITENEPTIREFITIKHKVQGAGTLGKWLWGIGGVILGFAAFVVSKATELVTIVPK